MARRKAKVLRNLDDRLMIGGVLSWNSAVFLGVVFGVVTGVDLMLDLWRTLFGHQAFMARLAVLVACALGLSYAERYEDEHFVVSAIRYGLERRWRVLYSGVSRDGWTPNVADRVLGRRGERGGAA